MWDCIVNPVAGTFVVTEMSKLGNIVNGRPTVWHLQHDHISQQLC